MPKQIATDTNASLSELEWTPGELVAFDKTLNDLDRRSHPDVLKTLRDLRAKL